jgi:hypothetical protein
VSRLLTIAALAALAGCQEQAAAPRRAPGPRVQRSQPRRARVEAIRAQWIHRLMRPDQAPPLRQPRHLSARQARGLLRPGDRVLGVWLGQQARAYPLNLLAYHRVVNDRLADQRIVVAHSPLSGSALCAATERQLRCSGQVYEGDDLLTDGAGGDLWSVALGRSIHGPHQGQRLERVPCAQLTWAAWRRLQPRTSVAWPARAPRGFDYRRDPWAWYRRDDRHLVAPLHYVDLRLPYKQPVIGLSRGPLALPIASRQVLNLRVGGHPVAVVLDAASGFGAAYDRQLARRTLTLIPRSRPGRPLELEDRETGSRWNLLGQAVGGPLRGQRLPRLGQRALFFAWSALHPGSAIRRTDTTIQAAQRAASTGRNDNG